MYRARPVVPLLVRLIVNRLKAVGGLQNYSLLDQTQFDPAAVREAMHRRASEHVRAQFTMQFTMQFKAQSPLG